MIQASGNNKVMQPCMSWPYGVMKELWWILYSWFSLSGKGHKS